MPACRVTLHVHPGARTNEVVGFDEAGRLKVRVSAPPADGKANIAVIELLSDALGIAKGAVGIQRGHTGRVKIVRVEGLGASELRARLER